MPRPARNLIVISLWGLLLYAVWGLMTDAKASPTPYFGPRSAVTVQMTMDTRENIRALCLEKIGRVEDACMLYPTADAPCRIYVPIPHGPRHRVAYQIVDHELGHCWGGAFHD